MRRRSRSLGDRAVARMVSIAPSSSAGGPDVETAVRTTGPLTAGRKPRGGVFCLNVHNDHWRETPLFRHWRKG